MAHTKYFVSGEIPWHLHISAEIVTLDTGDAPGPWWPLMAPGLLVTTGHWDESQPWPSVRTSPSFSEASSGGKLKKNSTLPWQWVQERKGANHHKIFLLLINEAKMYTFTFKYSLWLLSAPFVGLWAAWLVLVTSLRDNIPCHELPGLGDHHNL